MAERTKFCTGCQTVKPWSDYSPRTRWPDGSTRNVQCYCKACNAELCRNWRARKGEDPEKKRARQRKWLANLDAERMAIRRDRQREWCRQKHSITPDRYRVKPARKEHGGPRVDPGPFRDWLLSFNETPAELSLRTGVVERRLRSILNGEQETVEFDTVDRALTHYGEPWLLDELYPMEAVA